jgi:hypothetical protein
MWSRLVTGWYESWVRGSYQCLVKESLFDGWGGCYVCDDSMFDIKNVLAALQSLVKCCTESECWMDSGDRKNEVLCLVGGSYRLSFSCS